MWIASGGGHCKRMKDQFSIMGHSSRKTVFELRNMSVIVEQFDAFLSRFSGRPHSLSKVVGIQIKVVLGADELCQLHLFLPLHALHVVVLVHILLVLQHLLLQLLGSMCDHDDIKPKQT